MEIIVCVCVFNFAAPQAPGHLQSEGDWGHGPAAEAQDTYRLRRQRISAAGIIGQTQFPTKILFFILNLFLLQVFRKHFFYFKNILFKFTFIFKQIFTKPLQDRPTVFIEIIQRHNHSVRKIQIQIL